jgi:prepilin-type N-terminal cleavage/methylation domain-containing protein/prepilin-type processing-associated H-X9-DG protein
VTNHRLILQYSTRAQRRAFTLVELLVVIAVIAVLIAILLPSLRGARAQARAVVCGSNIRQLHLANSQYALEHGDVYVPAASDMTTGFGGRRRWHGTRESDGVDPDPERNTFDPRLGPLVNALADGAIKACPQRTEFVTEGTLNAFESGCGGYGYNLYGIGSRFYARGLSSADLLAGRQYQLGWWSSRVRQPADTVMFADTAFRQFQMQRGEYLIEYSFCEPPWSVEATRHGGQERRGEPAEWWLSTPSMHFRHRDTANIAWVDGHVANRRLTHDKSGSARWSIGWFGELNNAAFRPIRAGIAD